MKTNTLLFVIGFMLLTSSVSLAQDDFKHPHVNSSGHVIDKSGSKLGWIKDGVVYDADGKQMGKIDNEELFDEKGHKIGKLGKDGTLYDHKGTVIYTVEAGSDHHKILDAKGNVVGTVDDHYKNQGSAVHYLHKKKN